jgi:hypothetical protein
MQLSIEQTIQKTVNNENIIASWLEKSQKDRQEIENGIRRMDAEIQAHHEFLRFIQEYAKTLS